MVQRKLYRGPIIRKSIIAGQTVFQSIKTGFQAIGSAIWQSVKAVGRLAKDGFTFAKNIFSGSFGTAFTQLGTGIMNLGRYVVEGIHVVVDAVTGVKEATQLSIGQRIARMLMSLDPSATVAGGGQV